MCLSTVYKIGNGASDFVCKNVAKVETEGEKLIFTDIMGIKTTVNASIDNIDLMENIIYVKERLVSGGKCI